MRKSSVLFITTLFITIFVLNVKLQAQVTIGSADTPDVSAVLELKSSTKGFLGPRVALTSQTDKTTVPSPAVGLLVYNLGTAGLKYAGYVYWNGTEWRSFTNSSLADGTIGSITCNAVSITPDTYTAGVNYNGTLIIPYTGGNGGAYPAQTVGPVNGLTATLAAGNFSMGSGSLAYTLTGKPIAGSPSTTTFSINIGGQTCSATIGAGSGIAPGDLVFFQGSFTATTGSVWMSDYVSDLPIIGGKLRVDAWFTATSNLDPGYYPMVPRLVNITSQPVKIWYSAMTTVDRFNAGNYIMAAGGYVDLDNAIYHNYGYNDILGTSTPRASGIGGAAHQEVVTVDLSLDNKWYRIYYFPIVDNMNTTSAADNLRKIYVSIQRLN